MSAATALVDGDNGMGHLVVSRAAATAIELARDAGVAWVGVRRSNHAGTAGVLSPLPGVHGTHRPFRAGPDGHQISGVGGAQALGGAEPPAGAADPPGPP